MLQIEPLISALPTQQHLEETIVLVRLILGCPITSEKCSVIASADRRKRAVILILQMVMDKKVSDRWIAEICMGYMTLADEALKSIAESKAFNVEVCAIIHEANQLMDNYLRLPFVDSSRIQLVLDTLGYLISLDQQFPPDRRPKNNEVKLVH